MPKLYKNGLWLLIAMLAIFNVYRAYQTNLDYGAPIDFRGPYVGTLLFSEGRPLYNDSIAAGRWDELKQREDYSSNTDLGDPYINQMLYPPQTFTVLYPFRFADWKQARIIWWGICLLSVLGLLWLLYKSSENFILPALLISHKALFFAFILGQPMLPVLALAGFALYYHRRKPLLSGLLLGIAMLKFSLLIPIMLWLLLIRNYRTFISALLSSIVFALPVLLSYPGIIPEFLAKLSAYHEFIYQVHPRNIYTFNNSEIGIMLDFHFPRPMRFWNILNTIGLLAGYGLFAWFSLKKRMNPSALLCGLILVSFLFSYHLIYDSLLLFIPFLLTGLNKYIKWGLIGLIAALSLPYNTVFGEGSLLSFHYPIFLSIALFLLIFASFKGKFES